MQSEKLFSSTLEENQIRGVKELAKFLKCSVPTARKIKQSGKIKFYQFGRVFLFDKSEVLAGLAKGGIHE